MKKIVYLSGGVGGAKFAKGLSKLNNIDLSIIVNTGDDEYIHGVALSPDIDSVIYGSVSYTHLTLPTIVRV